MPTPIAPTLETAGAAVAEADKELIAATDRWRLLMIQRLDDLAVSLTGHVAETEAEDGLFASVLADAPRLAKEVARLTQEHSELASQLSETRAAANDRGLVTDPHRVEALHLTVHSLLSLLDGHCHRSIQLMQDSVIIDLGGPVG
ncbi:MAG: hypothetical protein ACI8TP_003810 [Acidimicrobiales bacterium]|jgi:hypothetical protein